MSMGYDYDDPRDQQVRADLADGYYSDRRKRIVERRGGWFVTGTIWSGPWATKEAAEAAKREDWPEAHRLNNWRARLAGEQ